MGTSIGLIEGSSHEAGFDIASGPASSARRALTGLRLRLRGLFRRARPDRQRAPKASAFELPVHAGGEVSESGADIDAILPPLNPFSKVQDRAGVKRRVIEKLKAYLQRFINLGR